MPHEANDQARPQEMYSLASEEVGRSVPLPLVRVLRMPFGDQPHRVLDFPLAHVSC
jgi:hypothetical protein